LYDFRDRLVATKAGVLQSGGSNTPSSETDGVHRPIVYNVLDNLGEVTASYQFDGDGINVYAFHADALDDGAPTVDLDKLRAMSLMSYDDQGRQYQSSTLDIDQSSGISGLSSADIDALPRLTSNRYFDLRGDLL